MSTKHLKHPKHSPTERPGVSPQPATANKPATDAPSPTLPPQQVPSPQKKPTLEMIRERAYHMWGAAGRPAGDGTEFWEQAESEINGMSGEWMSMNDRPTNG